MEKLGVKCCLSIRRAVLMEKRWILVGLSMEEGCFVEKREIAGRAGNDGERPGMTEGAAMTAFTRHARYSHIMPDSLTSCPT